MNTPWHPFGSPVETKYQKSGINDKETRTYYTSILQWNFIDSQTNNAYNFSNSLIIHEPKTK